MSIRSERIKLLIEQSKQSYQELEKITGIKKSSLQRYASGTTTKIPLDAIERLAVAFNVSQEYLMGWSEDKKEKNTLEEPKLTEGERKWLAVYHKLPNDEIRDAFTVMADAFVKMPVHTQYLLRDMFLGALNNQK